MNKRERQQQKREKKQASAGRKQSLMRYGLFAVAGILAIILAVTLYERLMLDVPTTIEVTERDQIKGYKTAPLTLVEYSDFECPSCAAQHRTFDAVWKQIRRDVKIIYRHYPIVRVHKNATEAAYYAEAAGKQGKFWDMHDALFAGQRAWGGIDDPTEIFDGYAKKLKLNMAQLQVDIESDEIKTKVKADIASGKSAGVSGTPTLFLEGKLLRNVRNPQNLIKAVKEAAKAKEEAAK